MNKEIHVILIFFLTPKLLLHFLAKPLPRQEDVVTGYQKIIMDAAKVGEDPLDVQDRDKPFTPTGSGTKADPFMIPSRNTRRYVLVERKFLNNIDFYV